MYINEYNNIDPGAYRHQIGMQLERSIRKVFNPELRDDPHNRYNLQLSMERTAGGLFTADEFANKPLIAAYLIIGRLYNRTEYHDNIIENFLNERESNLDEHQNDVLQQYANAVDELITQLEEH